MGLGFKRGHTMPVRPIAFPTLLNEATYECDWPAPPFSWRHLPAPGNDVAQPCRIESETDEALDGEMLSFEPAGRRVVFRMRADGPAVSLPFARIRRLTLTTPLQPVAQIGSAPVERVPAAAQERDYSLQSTGAREPLTGRTAGHVEAAEGMYLFTPVQEEASLQRVFVPRGAYLRSEFGCSAEETAAGLWIASREELLEALERQLHKAVQPLGQSLLALGLVTRLQLDRALARRPDEVPLGESLVNAGVITRADLETAIAHKMGYPLVNLARFPIDATAMSKLPQRFAQSYRAMPLMIDKGRMIVAVDKPSRVVMLEAVHAFAQLKVVPVLAPKMQILLALQGLSSNVWSHNVSEHQAFFDTTV
jgi:hypothetical protein